MEPPQRSPRVYPVVHVPDVDRPLAADTVCEQVTKAVRIGVAGIFLIDHAADHRRLLHCLQTVRRRHDRLFIGVNFIHQSSVDSLTLLGDALASGVTVNALWTDNAGVRLDGDSSALAHFESLRRKLGWQGLHFGGIAFKYQQPVPYDQLPLLGRRAASLVDVPTTSGPATGHAAARRKLELLREGLGDHPLALASGVTVDNIDEVRDLVDHILVSTGISDGHDGVDADKLAALMTKATAVNAKLQ